MSKISTLVHDLRKSLDNAIRTGSQSTLDYAYINDILRELNNLNVSADTIKDLKLGPLVANTMKQLGDHEVGHIAKELLIKFKRTVEENKQLLTKNEQKEKTDKNNTISYDGKIENNSTNESQPSLNNEVKIINSSESKTNLTITESIVDDSQNSKSSIESNKKSNPTALENVSLKTKQATTSTNITKNFDITSYNQIKSELIPTLDMKSLSHQRRATVKVLTNLLKLSLPNEKRCESIGLSIEYFIHQQYPIDLPSTAKQYAAKVRSVSFNLRTNQKLREKVVRSELNLKDLVTVPLAELAANEEQKKLRDEIVHEDLDGRRLDWLQQNKEIIQKQNGIDPNNEWVFDDDDKSMDSVPGED